MQEKLRALVFAAIRLAIVRHDLATDDCQTINDDEAGAIAEDTWKALNGIGTCDAGVAYELESLIPNDH